MLRKSSGIFGAVAESCFLQEMLGSFAATSPIRITGVVVLTGSVTESADWIRRFLRHPEFRTHAQRCQSVVKPSGRFLGALRDSRNSLYNAGQQWL
jgi:hypothetical protein